MAKFCREQYLAVAYARNARCVASLVDTHHDCLYMLLAVPQELQRKGATVNHSCFPITQQFAGLGGGAGHQRMPIAIDHKDFHDSALSPPVTE